MVKMKMPSRICSRALQRIVWQFSVLGFFAVVVYLAFSIMGSSSRDNMSREVQDNHHHNFPGYRIASDDDGHAVKRESIYSVKNKIDSSQKRDWNDEQFVKADLQRKGPGEAGLAVKIPDDPETKAKEDILYRANGYSGYASDLIGLNRSVKDARSPECKRRKYLSQLPKTSVILPFHDEHWSVLLRSCWSIINRTPPELLEEIVIVDDNSTKEFLGKALDDYVSKHLPKVKIVRTQRREGLIRARQIGARAASGEANYNWLPPLIEPIALDYRTVVCPFIDVIDCDNFEYRPVMHGSRGSFDWEFHYKQLPLTDKNKLDPSEPFDSPVMAGGYFAASTKWFWELGGYDTGLDIWGGEQYELSFKVWQCHGRQVDAPCSHVGHIYRCKYQPFPNPNVGDFISRNYKRVAEVWMDEYKEHLYKRMPQLRTTDTGDISKQLAVREKLKCKNFKWFMTEVAYDQDNWYPAVEPPDGAWGTIRSLAPEGKDLCVDQRTMNKDERLWLARCNGYSQQKHRHTWYRDIKIAGSSMCMDAQPQPKGLVKLYSCHGMEGNQGWHYDADKQVIALGYAGVCLDCNPKTKELFLENCDTNSPTQKWEFERYNRTIMENWKKHPRKIM